jgi:signal transduction histidine kinase
MARKNTSTIEIKTPETTLFDERFEKMSHDFRTPLNIIIGFAELMLDEVPGKINDEQRRSLTDILNSGRRLLGLLHDYLEQP